MENNVSVSQKIKHKAGHRWLIAIILASQKAEDQDCGSMPAQTNHLQNCLLKKNPQKKNPQKTRLVEWLKV
jgi:hypothetical protein